MNFDGKTIIAGERNQCLNGAMPCINAY